jgi:hypothetical protein
MSQLSKKCAVKRRWTSAGATPARELVRPREQEPGPSQTGLRRPGESLVNRHRETKATAPVLDSTLYIPHSSPQKEGHVVRSPDCDKWRQFYEFAAFCTQMNLRFRRSALIRVAFLSLAIRADACSWAIGYFYQVKHLSGVFVALVALG